MFSITMNLMGMSFSIINSSSCASESSRIDIGKVTKGSNWHQDYARRRSGGRGVVSFSMGARNSKQ